MSRSARARAEILDAAEQLIAERGMRVPLRDIALAAGQRNNSAVNYHFRNRQELIDAVIDRRLRPMEIERAEMLSVLDDATRGDVTALLRILVVPLTRVDSEHYARFLQAAALHLPTDLEGTQGAVWPRVLEDLTRSVPTSDPNAVRRRVTAVGTAMFALLAERERKAHTDGSEPESPEEIVAMLTGMLTAPVP
ncbi:TetR/AcrR family transcriptional regulator [Nocardia vermiculata]|uniref:TetR/AcrR family transcriptional regulator n=1 Tax=Nocardia vermiculata TaxID=257274 RepID=A0A846Y8U6_9NOCA|nr:TetR/AcrR family transcriptional regulator [Nocardia vermiculata]NKY54141.1 TetR/AcrR family transcriptional regulator [Nocardia vermiculata]